MNIDFYFEDIEEFSLPVTTLRRWLIHVIRNEQKTPGELSFIFCSDAYLLDMNKQFLEHDYFTDVITFDYVDGNIISGDVYISTDRIRENAAHFKVSFLQELTRVMVHGVLHLLGYKDKNEQDKAQMTEKEDFYLRKFFDSQGFAPETKA